MRIAHFSSALIVSGFLLTMALAAPTDIQTSEDARASDVAVSVLGDASCEPGGPAACVAVSGTGAANGCSDSSMCEAASVMGPASSRGLAASGWSDASSSCTSSANGREVAACGSASVMGSAEGGHVAVAVFSHAHSHGGLAVSVGEYAEGLVAVSVLSNAYGGYAGLAPDGDATGEIVAVSGDEDASSWSDDDRSTTPGVAVSGAFGSASSENGPAVAGTGEADGGLAAASGLSDATADDAAASGAGDATGNVAASGFGDANGGDVGISATGDATGSEVGVGGCSALTTLSHPELCGRPI